MKNKKPNEVLSPHQQGRNNNTMAFSIIVTPTGFSLLKPRNFKDIQKPFKHFPVSSNPNSNKKLVGVGIKFRLVMKYEFLKYGDWLLTTLLCF